MVDLYGQYLKIKPEIDAALQDVLDETAFIQGPAVKQFSKNLADYLRVKHVIPCGNGTDALQLALMALDLQPGDEVITTPFTFIATAEVIALLNLKPVFVDVLPDTYTIDPSKIEQVVTEKTKAIIPVHLFGQVADMSSIMSMARKYGLSVVEDTAQALGAEMECSDGKKYKAGTVGNIGCTSFFPSKNLGAFGDGGAVFTQDDKLAEKIAQLSNHGMKIRYHHDYIGINSRLDTLQAAVLNVKLKYLDEYALTRQKAAVIYDRAFSGNPKLATPAVAPFTNHVYHQYTLRLTGIDRAGLMDYLSAKGIASAIYYPVPLHLQKAYTSFGYRKGDFPVAELLSDQVISLPIHTEMTDEIQQDIVNAVLDYVNKN
ncbi:MAG: DegT/DnrJ/EryC1/StrS family aminotransferase [Bacteroidales bacterium]|nr:DegT/DnrJ/EryC1/StrS family aminotransferase [Bacteroidales bacterium]